MIVFNIQKVKSKLILYHSFAKLSSSSNEVADNSPLSFGQFYDWIQGSSTCLHQHSRASPQPEGRPRNWLFWSLLRRIYKLPAGGRQRGRETNWSSVSVKMDASKRRLYSFRAVMIVLWGARGTNNTYHGPWRSRGSAPFAGNVSFHFISSFFLSSVVWFLKHEASEVLHVNLLELHLCITGRFLLSLCIITIWMTQTRRTLYHSVYTCFIPVIFKSV